MSFTTSYSPSSYKPSVESESGVKTVSKRCQVLLYFLLVCISAILGLFPRMLFLFEWQMQAISTCLFIHFKNGDSYCMFLIPLFYLGWSIYFPSTHLATHSAPFRSTEGFRQVMLWPMHSSRVITWTTTEVLTACSNSQKGEKSISLW